MNDIMKLLAKRKAQDGEMSPEEQSGRMSVLESLKREMQGLMKNDLQKAPMSVEVAAKKPEDLESGLDLAKEKVGEMIHPLDEESSESEESDPLKEMAENKSSEELDEMIRQLEMLKASKK